ncbi:MAG: Clp protease N-terminal domain-containing protein, partial [Bradymonadia bacterium]
MTVSAKLDLIFDQAEEISRSSNTTFSSVHLLLSYFVIESPARGLLNRLNVDEERLLKALRHLGREESGVVDRITDSAWQMVNRCGHDELDSVWYLKALIGASESLAHQLIKDSGIDHKEIIEACWLYTRSQQMNVPGAEQRITEALGSIEVDETVVAHAKSTFGARQHRARRDTDMDDGERRSRSPGRRRSDRLDRRGSRRDRKPNANRSENPFRLDPQKFPVLSKLAINLAERAADGELDQVIGRENEITEIIDILSKKKSNNPLLIGESGVGKTALVEGVVNHLVTQER